MIISVLFHEIEILSNFFQFSNVARSVKKYWVVDFGLYLFWIDLFLIFRLLIDYLLRFWGWFVLDKVVYFFWWRFWFLSFGFLNLWLFRLLYRFLIMGKNYYWSRFRLFLIWCWFFCISYRRSRLFNIRFIWLGLRFLLLFFSPDDWLHSSEE